jgi:hypothetical protein
MAKATMFQPYSTLAASWVEVDGVRYTGDVVTNVENVISPGVPDSSVSGVFSGIFHVWANGVEVFTSDDLPTRTATDAGILWRWEA